MKIRCSWCESAGLPADLGETTPYEDSGVTHGICKAHKAALLADLPAQLAAYRARADAEATAR